DLAQFMVAVSDNAAANILIDRVGKDNVNAMLRGLGLSKTMLRRKMIDIGAAQRGDENVATPEEMVRLLEAIYKEKVLKKETTPALIKQLSTLKQSYIPRLLPVSVQVANKPGELEAVRTDSGIVFAPNRPFAISIMTTYDRDERAAERAISEVALKAYQHFEMRGKTSEYGRILPLLSLGRCNPLDVCCHFRAALLSCTLPRLAPQLRFDDHCRSPTHKKRRYYEDRNCESRRGAFVS